MHHTSSASILEIDSIPHPAPLVFTSSRSGLVVRVKRLRTAVRRSGSSFTIGSASAKNSVSSGTRSSSLAAQSAANHAGSVARPPPGENMASGGPRLSASLTRPILRVTSQRLSTSAAHGVASRIRAARCMESCSEGE